MPDYTTRLSIPRLGLQADTALEEVRAAVAERGHEVRASSCEKPHDEHVHVDVVLSAASPSAAFAVAEDVHDRALARVLSAASDGPAQGWTSGFDHPEPVSR